MSDREKYARRSQRIDVVLMVVAAGESIMPQTREHFEICRLLGPAPRRHRDDEIRHADADTLEPRMEMKSSPPDRFSKRRPSRRQRHHRRRNAALRDELARAAASASIKDASNFFRLPIDRSFSMRATAPSSPERSFPEL